MTEIVGLWNKIKDAYDGTSEGRFSKVLKTYSYMNPEAHFPLILLDAQNAFLDQIDFRKIGSSEKIAFKAYMKKLVQAVAEGPALLFENDYKTYYSFRHRWLSENLPFLKVPYNQGDAKDTNLGAGVCMSNSLNRIGILAANEDAGVKDLTMGSTSKTRMHQSRVGKYYFAAEHGTISFLEAFSKQLEQAEAFGIKHTKMTPIVNPSKRIFGNLIDQIIRHAKTGKRSFLVSLVGPKGGHAVNIQIDPKKGIYRFMDDNVGLLEYPDESSFRTGVGRFLAIVYRKYKAFAIDDFEKV